MGCKVSEMTDNEQPELERLLRGLARDFPYPETPHIAARLAVRRGRRRRRRSRLVARLAGAVAIALTVVLVAVPPVRAAVGEILRVGAVRIFQGEPGATPPPVPAGALTVLDLPGEVGLATARREVDFDLRLPAELGLPDRVFVLDLAESQEQPAVAMIWLEPERINDPRAALYVFPPNPVITKLTPQSVESVHVHDQSALWTEGPHYFELPLESGPLRLYVPGGVLIWSEGPLTYRLETDLGRDSAVQIAESLR